MTNLGDEHSDGDLVTRQHSITTDGHRLDYTTTTGRISLLREVQTAGAFDGHRRKADVFLTAYTVDADPAERPVTFCFNGGPGSSSIWLHLGLLAPRRVDAADVGERKPPPHRMVDNPQTLLHDTDLVFIDPVSTGYSRAAEGEKPGEHHGFSADVESATEIVRLWTTRNERWASPKFLAGEAYGALRVAGVADTLQTRHGMYVNGLMLLACLLDFGTLQIAEGNDAPYPLFLPTYAAIAHYHGLHGERPLAELLTEAEAFADRDYRWALARGHRLTDTERQSIVDKLAELTGLSTDYVDRVNLRLDPHRVYAEMLRHRRLVLGRLDARFTGPADDYARESIVADVSMEALYGAYSTALNNYIRKELGYANDLPYVGIAMDVNRSWSTTEFGNSYMSSAGRLAKAMRANPDLRVHVASGYYDGTTPYYATEQTLATLRIPAERANDIEHVRYESGHMMYGHEPTRVKQLADLSAFVRSCLSPRTP